MEEREEELFKIHKLWSFKANPTEESHEKLHERELPVTLGICIPILARVTPAMSSGVMHVASCTVTCKLHNN